MQIHWKGATFQQISAGIKYNQPSIPNMFSANAMRIYRKEIASTPLTKCNPRTSTKIDDFNMPGGGIINTPMTTSTGLVNTGDLIYENNTCEHPSANCQDFLSPTVNARRRVRSSGMIKKANADQYYTSSKQYINSRNRSFEQNQYFHVKYGVSTVKPGSAQSLQNIYQSNGVNHCEKYKMVADTFFDYKWLDLVSYRVVVPAGQYNIEDFNKVLHATMDKNYHYYAQVPSMSHVYLLSFTYDNVNMKVSIISTVSNSTIFPIGTGQYELPLYVGDVTWNTFVGDRNPSITTAQPTIIAALGFTAGNYPAVNDSDINLVSVGQNAAGITSSYVPIFYKPNNPQFGVQGAVSSGDLITRKKYDAITTSGSSFRSAYGAQTANALAYGSSMYGYTVKDKYGYPTKKTPTFSKDSNEMKQCSMRKLAHAI
jgi:hypothetical protein